MGLPSETSPAGCRYATMLVRQLMKGSTSVGAHKKLTEDAAATALNAASRILVASIDEQEPKT